MFYYDTLKFSSCRCIWRTQCFKMLYFTVGSMIQYCPGMSFWLLPHPIAEFRRSWSEGGAAITAGVYQVSPLVSSILLPWLLLAQPRSASSRQIKSCERGLLESIWGRALWFEGGGGFGRFLQTYLLNTGGAGKYCLFWWWEGFDCQRVLFSGLGNSYY